MNLEDYAVHQWYYRAPHVEVHTYTDPPYKNLLHEERQGFKVAKTRRIPFKRYGYRIDVPPLLSGYVFEGNCLAARGAQALQVFWRQAQLSCVLAEGMNKFVGGHRNRSTFSIGAAKKLLRVHGGYSNRKLRRMRLSVIRRKARELWLRKFAGPSHIDYWMHAAIDHEAKRIYTKEPIAPEAVKEFLSHQEVL